MWFNKKSIKLQTPRSLEVFQIVLKIWVEIKARKRRNLSAVGLRKAEAIKLISQDVKLIALKKYKVQCY